MSEAFENYSCTDCHKFRDTGNLGSAPDLTGWGSKDWLVRFIGDGVVNTGKALLLP